MFKNIFDTGNVLLYYYFSNSLHSKLSDNNILTLRIFMKILDNTQYMLDFNFDIYLYVCV